MSDRSITGAVQMGGDGPSRRSVRDAIDSDIAAALNELVKRGRDLVRAYEAAIHRVESTDVRRVLRQLEGIHGAHIRELSECIEALHATPAKHGDARAWIETGRVVLGDLRGDEGILRAMASNEATMGSAYRQARAIPGLPEGVREVLERAVDDELEHRAFYDRALRRFVG